MFSLLPDELIKHIHVFNDVNEVINYVLVCKNFHKLTNVIREQKMCHLIYLNRKYGVDQTFWKMETIEQAKYYMMLIQPHIWQDWWPRLDANQKLHDYIQDKVLEYYRQVISGMYTEHQKVEYSEEANALKL